MAPKCPPTIVESPIQKQLRRFKFRVTFIVTVTRSTSYIFWHQPQPHPTNSPLHLVNHLSNLFLFNDEPISSLIVICDTCDRAKTSILSQTLYSRPSSQWNQTSICSRRHRLCPSRQIPHRLLLSVRSDSQAI